MNAKFKASSCHQIKLVKPDSDDGVYYVQQGDSSIRQVYCVMHKKVLRSIPFPVPAHVHVFVSVPAPVSLYLKC